MNTTLLLTDEVETGRLMLKHVAFDGLAVRDTEAHAGCNCDRWGHPRLGVRRPRHHNPKRRLRFHHQSNNEIAKWNT
jgi:hypothetical protein